jgi:hypothetical protein
LSEQGQQFNEKIDIHGSSPYPDHQGMTVMLMFDKQSIQLIVRIYLIAHYYTEDDYWISSSNENARSQIPPMAAQGRLPRGGSFRKERSSLLAARASPSLKRCFSVDRSGPIRPGD